MAEMKYKELKKSMDLKNFGNLYFLTGEADLVSYFEEKILEEIKKRLKTQDRRDEVTRIYPKEGKEIK